MDYVLKKGDAVAKVTDQGAELYSYFDAKEYLWQGDENYWEGKSPVLFPMPGGLYNDETKIEGKSYKIPKHGFVKNQKFDVVVKNESSISLCSKSNSETLKMYPYNFELYVSHSLIDNGFKTEYRVVNTNNKAMVFCLGAHPSFNCPLNKGEHFENYNLVFEKPENTQAYYIDGPLFNFDCQMNHLKNENIIPLKYSDFDNDSYVYTNLKSNYVDLVHKKTNKGARITFRGFPVLVVWSPTKKEAPFICIEPWIGLPTTIGESGNFEDKPYAIKLDAEKEFTIAFTVQTLV
ncbi:MAG: aldose 1-epimerase family protein [Christensenellaceae bacterium]|nr:aldose 1-epimerase family protein [Christensenellaceae bacterium]